MEKSENTVHIHRLIDAIGEDLGQNSDSHGRLLYLLDPLFTGSSNRSELLKKDTPITELYYGLKNIASIGESALAWLWYLLHVCKSSKHTNELRKHITVPVVKTLKPKLILRMTLSLIASSLEDSEVEKMINFVCRTILETNPQNLRGVDGAFKALLLLFTRAERQQIITPDNITVLSDWLRVVKREDLIADFVSPFDANKAISIAINAEPEGMDDTPDLVRQCSDKGIETAVLAVDSPQLPSHGHNKYMKPQSPQLASGGAVEDQK